jgi:FG-GAP-like repeat
MFAPVEAEGAVRIIGSFRNSWHWFSTPHYNAGMHLRSKIVAATMLVGHVAGVSQHAMADDAIFVIQEVAGKGRVVTASFADFDGDRRTDLMLVRLDGIPPEESRVIHVYLGHGDGTFPATASHRIPVPEWSAIYDVADIKDAPGSELVLLRPDRITVLSIASMPAVQWELPVAGPSTVAASDDERGFDRFRLVYSDLGEEPWILVPQIGIVSAISADGRLFAQLEVGRRANYFVVPKSGIFSTESDIQLFLDVAKLAVGDVDGDGQSDIVASTRHEIRVFLRDDNGVFPRHANRILPLRYLSKRDHSRGSGRVVATFQDIDGDHRLDLMVTHVEGSFADAITKTRIFHNRDGNWQMDAPDDVFVSEGALGTDLLVDLEQDERPELVRILLKFSVLEIIELLLTQELDSQVMIHRLQPSGHFGVKPWLTKKISTGISFDTFRPSGFLPPMGLDLNADGHMDFITSANGEGIEVYLGGAKQPYGKRTAIQRLPTAGAIRFADINDDGVLDFVLWDPQGFDSSVIIGRNLGKLPASSRAAGRDVAGARR